MKVCVYAICKNEEKFVNKWISSMKEADEIYVLDTGSTDKTVELLKMNNINVLVKEIKPWRFDTARNESMKLLPKDTDICVCTDLDEVFEKGWRKKLEELWQNGVNRIAYNYNWSFDKYGNPSVNFYTEKIHSYNEWIWTHPVHEILTYIGKSGERKIYTDDITLNHYPDNTKSRGSYLKLLELSVKEDPSDDRNLHYLGREYMYYKKWNKAINTLIKHLNNKNAIWKEERCASMRFISRCYLAMNRVDEAKMWLLKAIEECPFIREGHAELGMLYYSQDDYKNSKKYFLKALRQKEINKVYINEPFCYNGTLYDYLSVCLYNLGKYKRSLYYINKAIKFDKDSERLKKNKEIIKEQSKK